MKQRPLVVIGLIGSNLDLGKRADRWQTWRPTISLCRQPDLVVKRFELLHSGREQQLAEILRADVATCSPETAMRLHRFDIADPWDFEQVYEALFRFARAYPFDT